MEVELQEIRDFLADVPPFDLLSEEALNSLVRKDYAVTITLFQQISCQTIS